MKPQKPNPPPAELYLFISGNIYAGCSTGIHVGNGKVVNAADEYAK